MENLSIAGYCRISVDEELDRDNTSIENQKAIIEDYVRTKFPEAELTFYADRDRSGYTFEQREMYQIMRHKLIRGEHQILVVKDFSRFSRRNSKGLVELEDLRDSGVRIIAIGDGIDYPTCDEWVQIQFRFLINEMPVTDASKKVKSVIQSRQREGKWLCAVPYGYRLTGGKNPVIEVEEECAEVVRSIFRMYSEGSGYRRIANYLTEKNIPTPRMHEEQLADYLDYYGENKGGCSALISTRTSRLESSRLTAKIRLLLRLWYRIRDDNFMTAVLSNYACAERKQTEARASRPCLFFLSAAGFCDILYYRLLRDNPDSPIVESSDLAASKQLISLTAPDTQHFL